MSALGRFTALISVGLCPCVNFPPNKNLRKRITVFGYFAELVIFSLTFLVFVFLFRGALICVVYMGFLSFFR
jgi:hypothetical protein